MASAVTVGYGSVTGPGVTGLCPVLLEFPGWLQGYTFSLKGGPVIHSHPHSHPEPGGNTGGGFGACNPCNPVTRDKWSMFTGPNRLRRDRNRHLPLPVTGTPAQRHADGQRLMPALHNQHTERTL